MRKVITLALLVLSVFAISSTASAATYYCNNTSVHGNSYSYVLTYVKTVAATCTSQGYKEYKCGHSRCGRSFKKELTSALGHNEDISGREQTPPTCTAFGVKRFYCSRCRNNFSKQIDPLGHDFVYDSYVRPDCSSSGVLKYKCTRCSEVNSEIGDPALGHSYSSIASASVEPTCTEPGYDTFDCRYCSDSIDEVADPALGHNYSILLERVEPTLTEEGSVTYQCSRCDAQTVEVIPIPDTHTHTWKEIDRVDPTKDEPGSVAYSCTCGEILTEVIEYASPVHDTTQALGKSILSNVWGLFSIHVPGFSFTFGQMYLGIILCSVSLLIAKMFFGIGGGGQSTRTGSTNNPKISKDRRNDEF